MPNPEREANKKRPKTNKSKNKLSRIKKKKPNPEDGIAKTKQLVQKLQTTKSSKGKSPRTTNNNEVRLCGNGKPMPSLAELEKMFEDSDSDGETQKKPEAQLKVTSPQSTPKRMLDSADIKLTSPSTIQKIAHRMLDLVTNLTEPPILLVDDVPPPPVIKPKKRKKSDIPYIVGCKERPYVPYTPNINFCKGEDDYGVVENNSEDDEEVPKKKAKRGKRVNLSKSIFNAVSDEIAARLKEQDEANSDASSDSNKTVAYEYYTPKANTSRSFSPLPSTSKDNETFVKNDQLFNESLNNEKVPTDVNSDSDIELIETPCETIVVNDSLPFINTINRDDSIIELLEDSTVDPKNNVQSGTIHCADDSVQVIEVKSASRIPDDNCYNYNNLDIETSYNNNDICEVIDIDDIIAENAAIIKKINKNNNVTTVTSVDLTQSIITDNTVNAESSISTNPDDTNLSTACPRPKKSPNRTDQLKTLENKLEQLQSMVLQKIMPYNKNLLETAINNLENRLQSDSTTTSDKVLLYSLVMKEHLKEDPRKNKMPASTVTGPTDSGGKKLGDCPICMDTLTNKTVASTMCGHIFCMNCIKLSIKSNGRKCPTCRKTLKGAGFHQIFL